MSTNKGKVLKEAGSKKREDVHTKGASKESKDTSSQ